MYKLKLKTSGLFIIFTIIIVLLWGNNSYHIVAFNFRGNSGEHQLRVLTWNICSPKIKNGKEQEIIARLIIAQNADFIQLNEFTLDSCLVIDSLLSKYYPYKNDAGAKVKAGDVFYSKTQLTESEWYKKVYNCVYSKLLIEKDSLFIIGCHLPGNNHEGRIEIDDADSLRRVKTFLGYYSNAREKRKVKAQFLKKAVLESTLPIIVMGDMNDFSASAPMDSLKDAGMKNAWWEGGLGLGATYHEGWLRLRIDHIYYNDKLRLEGVKVVKTDLSDHNILIADFSIAK